MLRWLRQRLRRGADPLGEAARFGRFVRLFGRGEPPRESAVAVVFRDGPRGRELLFVRRARRHGDRWSGNLAFPGGLAQAGDEDPAATARREALEEVGLELGEPRGSLSPLTTVEPGRFRPMRVHPVVFDAPSDARAEPLTEELAEAFWVPWAEVVALQRIRVWKRIKSIPFPARGVMLRGHLLWGLTFWMVEELVSEEPRGAR